jgi:hypothetical protein
MDPTKNKVTFTLLGIAGITVGLLSSIDIFVNWVGVFRLIGFAPIASTVFLLNICWRAWRRKAPVINWVTWVCLGVIIAAMALAVVMMVGHPATL